jgi:hypothetical protein
VEAAMADFAEEAIADLAAHPENPLDHRRRMAPPSRLRPDCRPRIGRAPRRRSNHRRPGSRRASGTRSGQDPGDGDPEPPAPAPGARRHSQLGGTGENKRRGWLR